ncbi:MAG: collagen-like protein [Oscillospiraceae bacterium]|nr:collagen-like protein [Oscillospiraceae bacterium]
MQRIIHVDLRSSRTVYPAGFIGENRHRTLRITPPDDLLGAAYFKLAFDLTDGVFRPDLVMELPLSVLLRPPVTLLPAVQMTLLAFSADGTVLGKAHAVTLQFAPVVLGQSWDLTGPPGPQGEQGEIGPIGPQGEPGIGIYFRGIAQEHTDLPAQAADGDAWFVYEDGKLYIWGDNGFPAQGDGIPYRGPQGEQGIQGLQGPQGIQGERGDTGPVGQTGETGQRGIQGEIGETGPQGERGEPGIQGPQGEQGDRGLTGERGQDGERGERGMQGDRGDRGPQGETGDPGPRGEQGETGLQGIQGLQGPQGQPGDVGPQGIQGQAGPQGAQGYTGEQGPIGPQGPQGGIGATGPQGEQGQPGIGITYRGAVDTRSELPDSAQQGDAFFNNADGLLYIWGDDGFPADGDGVPFRGEQGDQGIQGERGEQGDTGPQGVQGMVGPIGPQGEPGAQGPQGYTGPPGAQGYQGPPGETGPKGEPGTTDHAALDNLDFANSGHTGFASSEELAALAENIGAELIEYDELMAMSSAERAGRLFVTLNDPRDLPGVSANTLLAELLAQKLDKAVPARHTATVDSQSVELAYTDDSFQLYMRLPNVNQSLSSTPWRFLQGRSLQSIVDMSESTNIDLSRWTIGSAGQLVFPDFGDRTVDYVIDVRVTGSGQVAGNNSAEIVLDMLRQNAQTIAVSRSAVITSASPSFANKSLSIETFTKRSTDPYVDGGVVPRLSCGVLSEAESVNIVIKGRVY